MKISTLTALVALTIGFAAPAFADRQPQPDRLSDGGDYTVTNATSVADAGDYIVTNGTRVADGAVNYASYGDAIRTASYGDAVNYASYGDAPNGATV